VVACWWVKGRELSVVHEEVRTGLMGGDEKKRGEPGEEVVA